MDSRFYPIAAAEGTPIVVENIFTHGGALGHEVIFAAEVILPKDAFSNQDSITFHEDDGASSIARWFDLDDLDVHGGPDLHPSGFKALLTDVRRSLPR